MPTLNEILAYPDGWIGPGSKAVTPEVQATIGRLRLDGHDVAWFADADGAVQMDVYVTSNTPTESPMGTLEIDIAPDGSVADVGPILAFIEANRSVLAG